MAGPWEKYSSPDSADAAASGPWSKYAATEEPGIFDGAAKSMVDSLPAIGGVAGGILGTPFDALTGPAGTMGGAAIGGYLGTAAKNAINRYMDPKSAPQNMTDVMTQPVVGGVTQGLAQGTGEAVAPYIAKGVQAVVGPASDALSSFAAKKAVAATGATGAQAAKFAPNAGQELLDQGIVKFGDSQANVAQKATDALEQSGKKIGDILSDLDKKGVTVDQSDVVSALRKRSDQLASDPANFDVSDALSKKADRIQAMIDANKGNSEVPISQAENTKKGFQANSNFNSSPMDLSVNKETASIYRQAVEDAATQADPKAAAAFAAEKKAYGLLSPVQQAAEKRASTLNQSPHGGLLDTVATIAGEGVAGVPGAIIAPIARRAVSTRMASSAAGAANAAGKALGSVPAIAEGAAPAALQQMPSTSVPSAINSGVGNLIPLPAAAQTSPAKGPDKWAQQGIQKLGITDASVQSKYLQDPKIKQLLIQASDLAPGSKAMKNIQTQIAQIQKGWGQG